MWMDRASEEAKDMMKYFMDDIVEIMLENIALDLRHNRLDAKMDQHLTENYNYKSFTLKESCDILEELSDYEETDSGAFMKKNDMKKSLQSCAVYTYQNGVKYQIGQLVEEINEDFAIQEMAETENEDGLRDLLKKVLE